MNEENSNFSDEWIISHYHKFKIQKAQLLEEIGLLNFLRVYRYRSLCLVFNF